MCESIGETQFVMRSPSNGSTNCRSPWLAMWRFIPYLFQLAVRGERCFVEPFDGERMANGVLPSDLHLGDLKVHMDVQNAGCGLSRKLCDHAGQTAMRSCWLRGFQLHRVSCCFLQTGGPLTAHLAVSRAAVRAVCRWRLLTRFRFCEQAWQH